MPVPIKLISLDIDGTLYGPKGSPFDAKKLIKFQMLAKKLRAKGVTPIICTGKTAGYVEAFAEAYGLVGRGASHVCEHGATIFIYAEWTNRQYIDLAKFASKDFNDLEKVVAAIVKKLGGKKEQKSNSASINHHGMPSNEFYSKAISIIRGLGYNVIESANASAVAKEFVSMAGKSDAEIKSEMQKKGADFCVSLSPMIMNLTPFPLTKAFGLAYAASRIHKCGLENVVAIGDDAGDMPVFGIAGLPVAVGNAGNETKNFVKQEGGVITKAKSLDGVMGVMDAVLKYKNIEDVKEHLN